MFSFFYPFRNIYTKGYKDLFIFFISKYDTMSTNDKNK